MVIRKETVAWFDASTEPQLQEITYVFGLLVKVRLNEEVDIIIPSFYKDNNFLSYCPMRNKFVPINKREIIAWAYTPHGNLTH